MATALPERDRAELARLVRDLQRGVGALLLEAARHTPPPWPERDPTEDLDEPAITRKQRRREAK